jgi:hypothetical protein
VDQFGKTISEWDRFDHLDDQCTHPDDLYVPTLPFGYDPIFLKSSSLYKEEFEGMQQYVYPPTTAAVDDDDDATTTTETTKNILNAMIRNFTNPSGAVLPYAFPYEDGFKKYGGYGVFFDIDMNYNKALNYITFMRDGHFFDQHTKAVNIHFMTYNGNLQRFIIVNVEFKFVNSGFITVDISIQSIRLQLYVLSFSCFLFFTCMYVHPTALTTIFFFFIFD